jgi:hypothetical protein
VALAVAVSPLAPTPAAASPQFEATFATASDFYDQFDYGYSGISPFEWNGGGNNGAVVSFHGDHDDACGAPTTSRQVELTQVDGELDYSQVFWHCTPGNDPTKGHVMTAVDTLGYNTAWFAPKPYFEGISQVCWDINITSMSHRKWTQVLFVGEADATRYPSTRGSGGYDLGYTSPEFRQGAPNNDIFPQSGDLAGLKVLGGMFGWFQEQDTWTEQFAGAGQAGVDTLDKATRYKHCVSNNPDNTVRITQDSPIGPRSFDVPGQIPQGPVRVVFQDDNYDPAKDERYAADRLTWHWDNIQIDAASQRPGPARPSPEQLAAARPEASARRGDGSAEEAAKAAPGDSDEVSFGSVSQRIEDAVASRGTGPIALVAVAVATAGFVMTAYWMTRRKATTARPDPDDAPAG